MWHTHIYIHTHLHTPPPTHRDTHTDTHTQTITIGENATRCISPKNGSVCTQISHKYTECNYAQFLTVTYLYKSISGTFWLAIMMHTCTFILINVTINLNQDTAGSESLYSVASHCHGTSIQPSKFYWTYCLIKFAKPINRKICVLI